MEGKGAEDNRLDIIIGWSENRLSEPLEVERDGPPPLETSVGRGNLSDSAVLS